LIHSTPAICSEGHSYNNIISYQIIHPILPDHLLNVVKVSFSQDTRVGLNTIKSLDRDTGLQLV
jgi:hypothetical protein